MRKLILGLGAAVVGLALTGTVQAHEGGHRDRHVAVRPYYREHAQRFSGGYYYVGHDHHHWSRQVWNGSLRRWEYFDPSLNVSFYWYAPGNCYYPVTYCP